MMPNNPQQALQQARLSLQQGDAKVAHQLFSEISLAQPDNPQVWLGIALACSQLDNAQDAITAIDKVLSADPKNLRALIFKADQLVKLEQPRTALPFYEAALQLAANQQTIPGDIQGGLKRAKQLREAMNQEYSDYLLDILNANGYRKGVSKRFDESLAISFGKSRIFIQEPTRYYFPGLPQKTFYERDEFSWTAELEAQTGDIRHELKNLTNTTAQFKPYLNATSNEPNFVNELSIVDSLDWSAFYIWEYGELVAEHAALCPKTTAALTKVPLPHIGGQTPIALFSKLKAQTTIPPHHGLLNTRLICHLPIIVPENCGALRVGNDTRQWQEGELLIFDDSIEHEAWNRSDRDRVVLLFDIWRPELSEEERHLISQMLIAVSQYGDED